MVTDPIADLLTRIRNAIMANHKRVIIPISTTLTIMTPNHIGSKSRAVIMGKRIGTVRTIMAKELKMAPSTVWGRICKLRHMQKLDIQTDSHYSIITIRNWELYQNSENENRQANRQLSDRHPTGIRHIQELKNDKNAKKKDIKKTNTIMIIEK